MSMQEARFISCKWGIGNVLEVKYILPKDRLYLEDREEYLVTMKRRFLRVDGPLRSWNTDVQEEGNGACVMLRTEN